MNETEVAVTILLSHEAWVYIQAKAKKRKVSAKQIVEEVVEAAVKAASDNH